MVIIDTTSLILGSMFFTSFWAGVFSVIFIIAAILVTAMEEYAAAYVAFIVYLILMAIFTPANPFTFMWHNPAQVFGFFIGYFVIGAIYSTIKYWSYVKTLVNVVKDTKAKFIEDKKLNISLTEEIPEVFKQAWGEFKCRHMNSSDRSKIDRGLRPGDNAGKITNWIAFWPFSAVGLFVADPLRHLVTGIYQHLISIYGKMYERIINSNINMKDL